MKSITLSTGLLCLFLVAVLSACQKVETETVVENIRPIKTLTLQSKVDAVEERRFPGLVSAADSSTLSFEVTGKVLEINVDVGDQVEQGQLLAIVDEEPFKLNVQSAQADLKKARANHKNALSDFKRKSELRTKGYVSASDMDQALAQRDSARNQVSMAESQLNIARRNLRNTKLKAPFGGYISRRLVEPHQEVTSGQSLFQLDQLDIVEVELMLPENVISHLDDGDVGVATFTSLQGTSVEGRISEIGTQAETLNTFPVSLQLYQRPEGLLPGMTAEVEFQIEQGEQAEGFLVPASALIAGIDTGPGKHFVFIYDEQSSTVRKTDVFITGGQQQMARVSQGLKEGDIVAVAGASFLSDGMKVRLLEQR